MRVAFSFYMSALLIRCIAVTTIVRLKIVDSAIHYPMLKSS